MKFYDEKGIEINVDQFESGSLVVARVTKPMTNEEFINFCKHQSPISRTFGKHGINLIFCPNWVEFKEWK